jgi:hypothetical protein
MSISTLSVLVTAIVASLSLSPVAWAQDKEASDAPGIAALPAIPVGNVVLYLGTGLRSSNSSDAAVAIHCTSYVANAVPTPYPIIVTIEYFEYDGSLVSTQAHALTGQNNTRTAATNAVAVYDEDTLGAFILDQGSVRMHASKAHAGSILCSAVQTSKVEPPAYQSSIPLTRVAKFKAPKATFTP